MGIPSFFNRFDEPEEREWWQHTTEEDFLKFTESPKKKGMSSKRRRGLLLGAFKSNVLKTTKTKNVLLNPPRIRSSRQRTKPIPKFYFELHKKVRRKF
jgi:hypothetical protein